MNTWKPMTLDEIALLLNNELLACQHDERIAFANIQTTLRTVPIERYGKIESVFVVAQRNDQFLIYEDIEMGFEWCKPDADGVIREYQCNQFTLSQIMYQRLHPNSNCTTRAGRTEKP